MKKILYLALLLAACNDKHDAFVSAAPPAGLSFSKDTLDIREKDYYNINGSNKGVLMLYSGSSGHQMNIEIMEPTGKVHFDYRGQRIGAFQPLIVAGDSTSVFCSCDTAGTYPVDFYLTDQLGRMSQRTLLVRCHADQPASSNLVVSLVDNAVPGNWVCLLDGTGSQTPDGIITAWHFLVEGQDVFSSAAQANWTFHSNGLKTVGLYVVDDLGQHSDTMLTKILLP